MKQEPALRPPEARPGGVFEIVGWEESLARFGEHWDELAARPRVAPDLTRFWAQALVGGHAMDPRDVRVLIRNTDDGPDLLFPYYAAQRKRGGLAVREIAPLGNAFCFHHDVLAQCEPATLIAELFGALCAYEPAWDVMEVRGLVKGSPLARAWRSAAEAGEMSSEELDGVESPYLEMDCAWADYLARRSSNFRYNLKRKHKKLAARGRMEFQCLDGAGDIPEIVRIIDEVEAKSWKDSTTSPFLRRPWERRFHDLLFSEFAPRGAVRGTVLKLDDKPLAYDLSLIHNDVGYCLNTGFDLEWAQLSPGIVLRAHLMERLFERGLREYDFLGSRDRYKMEWTDTVRPHSTLVMYRGTWRSRAILAARPLRRLISRQS